MFANEYYVIIMFLVSNKDIQEGLVKN